MATKQANFKVIMFPWLGHAHLSPFLELAKNLSKYNFQIHLCSTPIILDSIKHNLKKHDHNIQLIQLHLQSLPNLPPHYHTTKNIPPHLIHLLIKAFNASSSKFDEIIARLKPDILIYDGFQPWAAKAAASHGVPAVFFCVSGSVSLSFFHHMYTHKRLDTFPSTAIRIKDYELGNLVSQGESMKFDEGGEGFLSGVFELSCEIVLIKSCRGIEGKYMDHLAALSGKRIVPTGRHVNESKLLI